MEIDPQILSACPDQPEAAIVFLRQAGLSKIESIKVLHDRFNLSLVEGKSLVHLSPAWADVRRVDDALHEELLASIVNSAND
ncbi:hypothetical protein [Caulobacter sp. BK020]|uniref:hypothetical protein n=1 Tax=Caulobacter sp. BK020 TaxID=2512117 RepID=UPI00104453A5|nr:hypothetical protein [Caulobacter sp. BK020]TCS16517.1 hypothetical protein EV278_10320 [Caulobacter sp. BK020]